ncbi:MAG: aldo/keto reductase [Pseudomonadota bacterium]
MRYKFLGHSGLRVSELCLGTMTFGEDWRFGASKEESQTIFDAFCEAGGNFIDTANTYTYGTSEKFVGDFIASKRDHFVLSTKYSLSTQPDDPNGGGNHRKNMFKALEQSLRQLKTDYIDIYWLHVWDFVTPIEEIMRGLDDLIRSGKVHYIGISNTPAWIISQANMLAELRGWTKFIGLQTEYNLIERTSERDLLPMAKSLGLGVLAWGPLAGGVLTGKYKLTGDDIYIEDSKRGNWLNSDRLTRTALHIAAEVAEIATELNRPPAQIALNWMRQKPDNIIPMIAGRTLSQFQQNLGCLEFQLEPSQLERLNEVSKISPGFPHHFLAYPPLLQALRGNKGGVTDFPPTS